MGEEFALALGRDLLEEGPGLGAFGEGAGEGELSDARGDLDIPSSGVEAVEKKMHFSIFAPAASFEASEERYVNEA